MAELSIDELEKRLLKGTSPDAIIDPDGTLRERTAADAPIGLPERRWTIDDLDALFSKSEEEETRDRVLARALARMRAAESST